MQYNLFLRISYFAIFFNILKQQPVMRNENIFFLHEATVW